MTKTLTFLLTVTLLLPTLGAQDVGAFKFEIETLGGQKLSHDDFQQNVVIVDFWGTWCEPCVKSVPGLVRLYKKYKHHGLEIVGLNYQEKGTKESVLQTVRAFAAEHEITYTLAIGSEKIRDQIVGFGGYPTMVFFKKGMKFDHIESGFDPEGTAKLEKWIRAELGLDREQAKGGTTDSSEKPEEDKKEDAKIKVAEGVIFRPGLHDTGFDFTAPDSTGKEVKFADFRGKRVVLALTSTWDHEAANTASLLQELHARWTPKGVVVIAASLEMKAQPADKLAAVQAFEREHKTSYPILPVGLPFLKKLHQPEGLPMFLVFDTKGVLVLRQGSASKASVLEALKGVLDK